MIVMDLNSRINLGVGSLFVGVAVVIELTKTGKRAKILTESGEVVILKIRHLEVINEQG